MGRINLTSEAPEASPSSLGFDLLDSEAIPDEHLLYLMLRSLARVSSIKAFAAVFVPQVGRNQGQPVQILHRINILPDGVQARIERSIRNIDLDVKGKSTSAYLTLGKHQISSLPIGRDYDINIGHVFLIHDRPLSLRQARTWLRGFETLISFRKESRALSHHRKFLRLDTQKRDDLDENIGQIIHSAVQANQTLIFRLGERDVFETSFNSAADRRFRGSRHVRVHENLITQAYRSKRPLVVNDIGAEGQERTGLEDWAAQYKYSSCIIAPVSSEETCYCVIVSFFARRNAVSRVERRVVDSLSSVLGDYYRLWYRNHQMEQTFAQAEGLFKRVQESLLVVDVLHDASEDLTSLHGHLQAVNGRTDVDARTLGFALKTLRSLITATRHFKSFYQNFSTANAGGGRAGDPSRRVRGDRVCPYEITESLEGKYRRDLIAAKVTIINKIPPDLKFKGIEHCVRRAVDNAIKNSIFHLQNRTHVRREIEITGRRTSGPPTSTEESIFGDGTVEIEVSDNGPGASEEELRTARQKFVSHRGGMGLGIPIMEAACESHGGKIDIESKWGKGFKVSLKFRELADKPDARGAGGGHG